jgi:hypothetical protein
MSSAAITITSRAKEDYIQGNLSNLYVDKSANELKIQSYRDCTWPKFVQLKHLFSRNRFTKNLLSSTSKIRDYQIWEQIEQALSPKDKFKRAVNKTKLLAKGSLRLEKTGIKPKVINHEYWIEKILPEKYSGQFLSFLKMYHAAGRSKLPIELWIKTPRAKECIEDFKELIQAEDEYNKIELFQVEYASENERGKYEVSFQRDGENSVLIRNNEVFKTSQYLVSDHKKAIFVMDDQKMYAHFHKISQFHHSSFLSGGPVAAAGEIITDNEGHIESITNKSGHYKPGKQQMLRALAFLKEQGVNLENVTLSMMGNSESKVYDANEYLLSNGQCDHIMILPSEVTDNL